MGIFGGVTDCREVMEAEEKLSLPQSYCQSWGCSWAQHSTAKPLTASKKICIFQPLLGSTVELVPWEKTCPKGRFSSCLRDRWPVRVRGKVAMAQSLGKAMPPPGSRPKDQRTPQSCLVALALVFCCFGVVLSRLTTFLGTTSPGAPKSQKPHAKGTSRTLTSHQTLKCKFNATGKVSSSF